MENLLCIGGSAGIIGLIVFFYLLNTARKKTPTPTAGKKEYTPVYISIADNADNIMRGMDKFVVDVQKTESAGDKWRWIPLLIFFAGLGLILIDLVLDVLGYFSFIFSIGGVGLWIAAVVLVPQPKEVRPPVATFTDAHAVRSSLQSDAVSSLAPVALSAGFRR